MIAETIPKKAKSSRSRAPLPAMSDEQFDSRVERELRIRDMNERAATRIEAREVSRDENAPQAVVQLPLESIARHPLNPIERAELMQLLMRPIAEGGSGMTLTQSGHVFGLQSESGAKNALRVLKLPAKIRDLVISGEMPERVARRLVPYAVSPQLMAAIAEELTSRAFGDEAMAALWQSSDQPFFIEQAIYEHTRPISSDLRHRYPYPLGEHPCLFDWAAHEQALQLVEIPVAVDHDFKKKCDIIEHRKFAQNVKLWDKLNEPFVKAAAEREKASRTGKPKGKGSSASKPKALSPAEQKADDKRKAAEAERRLDTFTRDWLGRLIRCNLAGRSSQDELVALTLPWLVGQCAGHDLRQAHQQALTECQIQPSKSKDRIGMDTLLMLIAAKNPTQRFDVLNAFWRVLLWPVSNLIGDEAKRSTLTPAGELPDKLIPIGYSTDNLVELAALGSVSVETAWRAGATDGSDERRLISVWLCRHTKAQLQKLRLELNVTEGSETMGRDELAGCVLNAHRPGKPLNLPKRLGRKSK